MAYCSQTDLEAAIDQQTLIDLTDDEQAATVPGDLDQAITDNPKIATRLTAAIVDASSTIDGYLRGRYAVPLASTPAFVRKLGKDLALHNLFSRRAHGMDMPPAIEAKYKAAMDALRSIRDGKLDLGVEPPPAASTAIVADTDGPDRLFTADTLKDY